MRRRYVAALAALALDRRAPGEPAIRSNRTRHAEGWPGPHRPYSKPARAQSVNRSPGRTSSAAASRNIPRTSASTVPASTSARYSIV